MNNEIKITDTRGDTAVMKCTETPFEKLAYQDDDGIWITGGREQYWDFENFDEWLTDIVSGHDILTTEFYLIAKDKYGNSHIVECLQSIYEEN